MPTDSSAPTATVAATVCNSSMREALRRITYIPWVVKTRHEHHRFQQRVLYVVTERVVLLRQREQLGLETQVVGEGDRQDDGREIDDGHR